MTIHHKGKKLSALTIAPVEAGGVWPAKGEFGRWRDVVQQYGIKRGCLYNLVAEGKVKSVSLRRKGNVKGCRLGNRHGHRYRRGCPWNFAPRYPLIIFLNECQTMTPSILSFPDLPCCFRRIIQPFTITQQRNLNLLKRSMLKNIIRDLVKDVHGACLRNDVPDSENKRQQGCFLKGRNYTRAKSFRGIDNLHATRYLLGTLFIQKIASSRVEFMVAWSPFFPAPRRR